MSNGRRYTARIQIISPVMRRFTVLLSICAAGFSSSATAGLLDDIEDLDGKTVVYAGTIEQLSCPIGGKYDCTKWPMDFYRTTRGFKEICFVPSGYVRCSYSCKGIIAVGEEKKPFVFFIESMGGELKKASFEVYKCPSPF